MSKIGQQVIEDMENHPELYDDNESPDYNPENFVPLPISELNKVLDNLPF